MPNKSPEQLAHEQVLWDVFLTRCLMRNHHFIEASRNFQKTFKIIDDDTLSELEYGGKAALLGKEVKKDARIVIQKLFPKCYGSCNFLIKIFNRLKSFREKWGHNPVINFEKEDKKLSEESVFNEKKQKGIFYTMRPPVKLWSKKMKGTSYTKIGIDLSYPLNDIATNIGIIKEDLLKGNLYLKRISEVDEINGIKERFLRYSEHSLDCVNKMFSNYDNKKGSYRITIETKPRKIAKLYYDPLLLDGERNAYRSKVQRQKDFIKSCVEDIQKLIFPSNKAFNKN